MNPSFLTQLAREIRQTHGDQLVDLCIVLPSRRGALFLREALAKEYKKTIWAPNILAIQDLVRQLSGWQFPEQLALIFELYQVYQSRMRQDNPEWYESFEQFYAWGEMLLSDFDEVDRYLADAQGLFTNIRDLKEIEATFGLSEEDQEALANFWRSVHGEGRGEYSDVKNAFLQIWEVLYDIYDGFRQSLMARNLAYDGMAYRRLAESLKAEEQALPWRHVVFAGFNALSGAEISIIRTLLDRELADVYWDLDRSFVAPSGTDPAEIWFNNPINQEAGRFIRPLHKKWREKGSHLISTQMAQEPKKIYLTGVPQAIGEARYLGGLLEKNLPQHGEETELRQHAVVLADENLLFPVLYNLPASAHTLNITMGFPLRHTTIYHLLSTLASLIRNQVREGDDQFPYQEVIALLNNPYLKSLEPHLSERLQLEIRKRNLVYVPKALFEEQEMPELLRHIFQTPADLEELTPYFDGLFDQLLAASQEREAHVESEYIFQFYTLFNQLKDLLDAYQEQLSLRGYVDIFREVMRKGRIPFQGEPLEGLQVMGFLETRTLDFQHVYILGANEGMLPNVNTGNSFIPFHLRKGFGMPTYEEKDALYAYHMFRLLQRAEEVHIIYNADVAERGSAGEKSRFIHQLQHFGYQYPGFEITERKVQVPAPYSGLPDIQVPHSEEVRSKLIQKYTGGPGKGKHYLSATALNSYLHCSLQFYFRYIADIKEPEVLEESMEAGSFGSVLHTTMENLYGPYLGKRVDPEDIEGMGKKLTAELQKAFASEHLGWGESLKGKNLLYRDVIYQLCKDILKQDHASEAFEVAHIEESKLFLATLEYEGREVRINGMFDRVDHLVDSGLIRIVDYKTGNVSFPKEAYQVEQVFHPEDEAKTAKGLKEAFQGFLYAWLYLKKFPENEVAVGYYTARNLSQGMVFLNDGEAIRQDQVEEVESRLQELIARIFSQDFVQTDNDHTCRICAYREICDR